VLIPVKSGRYQLLPPVRDFAASKGLLDVAVLGPLWTLYHAWTQKVDMTEFDTPEALNAEAVLSNMVDRSAHAPSPIEVRRCRFPHIRSLAKITILIIAR
jgi:hypothetical protein